jgi:hypothetical protein
VPVREKTSRNGARTERRPEEGDRGVSESAMRAKRGGFSLARNRRSPKTPVRAAAKWRPLEEAKSENTAEPSVCQMLGPESWCCRRRAMLGVVNCKGGHASDSHVSAPFRVAIALSKVVSVS